jgi:hypothetical protein
LLLIATRNQRGEKHQSKRTSQYDKKRERRIKYAPTSGLILVVVNNDTKAFTNTVPTSGLILVVVVNNDTKAFTNTVPAPGPPPQYSDQAYPHAQPYPSKTAPRDSS